MKKIENPKTSYQRLRKPLHEDFEEELRNKIEGIIIDNYKSKNITTRFDYDFIILLSKEIIEKNNELEVKLETLYPSWLRHFANRIENSQIRRFITP